MYSNLDLSKNDFFAFEGKIDIISYVIKNGIRICPIDTSKAMSLSYVTVQVDLTNHKHVSLVSFVQSYQKKMSHLATSTTEKEKAAQKTLDKIKFTNIEVILYNAVTFKKVNEGKVFIIKGYSDCKDRTKYYAETSLNSDGKAFLYNIEHGIYTLKIIGDVKKYKIFCQSLEVKVVTHMKHAFFISPQLANGQIRIQLFWQDPNIDINLFGTYDSSDTIQNTVGFFEDNSGGMSFIQSKNKEPFGRSQTITIETLGKYKYLFYIKQILSKKYKDLLISQKKTLNSMFLSSHFYLTIYVSELNFPANYGYLKLPTDSKKLEAANKEENLAFLFGCIDGNRSNYLNPINKLWVQKYVGKAGKPDGAQLPSAGLCEIEIKY